MDWNVYKNYLLSCLPNAKLVSGGSEINCRCMECPDSKDPRHGHFYINIPYDNKSPSWYYCHKCNCGGIIDHNTLIKWGIYNKDIAMVLIDYNNSVKKYSKNNKYFNRSIYNIYHNNITIDNKSEFKRRYICGRLGRDLSFEELNSLKIIINLWDLLKENNISSYTRDYAICNDLDRDFIGFLSIDNAFLNMRRTVEEGIVYKSIDKRYVNYRIFDKIDTSQRFYTVPTKVNLNTPNRIKLHIAEGPMDILSIYLNLRYKEDGIYTSVSGSNYMNIILYFLIEMRLPNLEIHMYPDNDKYGSMDRMKSITNKIPDPCIPVYLHYNKYPNEKDFGVPSNKIYESIIQIR